MTIHREEVIDFDSSPTTVDKELNTVLSERIVNWSTIDILREYVLADDTFRILSFELKLGCNS